MIQATNPIPQAVANLSSVVSMSAGEDFTCALLSEGSVQCWGENDRGQIGVATLGNFPLPQSMISGAFQLMIAGGQAHSCMVNSGGVMRCAGESLAGRLGNNQTVQSPQSTPVSVQNLDNVIAIATGREHSCAVRATGQAFCWGNGGQHRLGYGSLASRSIPTAVTGF